MPNINLWHSLATVCLGQLDFIKVRNIPVSSFMIEIRLSRIVYVVTLTPFHHHRPINDLYKSGTKIIHELGRRRIRIESFPSSIIEAEVTNKRFDEMFSVVLHVSSGGRGQADELALADIPSICAFM